MPRRPRPHLSGERAERRRAHDLAPRADQLRQAAPGPHARAALQRYFLHSLIR
jgi:hypothetical protein